MEKSWYYVKVFLLLVFGGMFVGCAELDELRALNRRQAITIRDQADEIERLRKELDSERKLSGAYGERLKAEEELRNKLRQELENLAKSIGGGAVVRETAEGPVIQLPEMILFDPGMAEIKPDGEAALQKIAEYIKARPGDTLRIDGHTDSDPIVKTKYLWDSNHHLAAGRALAVFKFLTQKQGIDESRIYLASFGPNRPIADNNTTAGKRKNRRVEFLILQKAPTTGGTTPAPAEAPSKEEATEEGS